MRASRFRSAASTRDNGEPGHRSHRNIDRGHWRPEARVADAVRGHTGVHTRLKRPRMHPTRGQRVQPARRPRETPRCSCRESRAHNEVVVRIDVSVAADLGLQAHAVSHIFVAFTSRKTLRSPQQMPSTPKPPRCRRSLPGPRPDPVLCGRPADGQRPTLRAPGETLVDRGANPSQQSVGPAVVPALVARGRVWDDRRCALGSLAV